MELMVAAEKLTGSQSSHSIGNNINNSNNRDNSDNKCTSESETSNILRLKQVSQN
jgi:hypothetical protein